MLNKDNVISPARRIVDLYVHKDGTRYFRINWRDTWEPESHLIECKSLLQQFWKEYGEDGVLKKEDPDEEENDIPPPETCECGKILSLRKSFVTKSTQFSGNTANRQCDQGVQVDVVNRKNRHKGVQCVPRTVSSSTQHSRDSGNHVSVGTDNINQQGLLLGAEVLRDQPLEFSVSAVDDGMATERNDMPDSDMMKEMIFVTDAPLSLDESPKQQQPQPEVQQSTLTGNSGQKLHDAAHCGENTLVSFSNSISLSMENSKVLPPCQSTPIATPPVFQVASDNSAAVAAVLLNSLHAAGGMSEEEVRNAIQKCAVSPKPDTPASNEEIVLPVPNEPYMAENIHAGLEVTDPTDILCSTYKPTAFSTPSQSSNTCTPIQQVKKTRNKRKRYHEKNSLLDCADNLPQVSKKTRKKKEVFSDNVNISVSDTLPPSSSDESGSVFEPKWQKSEPQIAENGLLMSAVSSIETSVPGGAYDGSSIVQNMPVPSYIPSTFGLHRVSEEKNINDAFISKYWR